MPRKFANRVKETTTTTGTGTLDLAGAATGFRAFADELTSGDEVWYTIVDDPDNPTEYEFGYGTFATGTPNTLTRDSIDGSSNSGNKVSWSAGTKTVIATPTAASLTGGWQLIESQDASASSSLDFTTGIDSLYDAYVAVLTNVLPATNQNVLHIRVSESAAFKSGASDYEWSHSELVSSSAGWVNDANDIDDSEIQVTRFNSNVAGEGISGHVYFWTPADAVNHLLKAELHTLDGTATPALRFTLTTGVYNGTTNAIDGIQFLMSSGNITSGTIALYGLRK